MPKTVEVEVEIVHRTAGAVLVNDGSREVWLPRDAIEEDVDEFRPGETVTLTMSERLATEKGLL